VSAATVIRRCTPEAAERSLFDEPMGGETTLEELIAGVWEGLAVHGTSSCPVCGAQMEARHGAHARPVDGRCASCGTTLA
jgi:tRNA(Ile2) C34 agmatinyltransferase TiaS